MATNPLYNTNDSPNNQTQPTKAVNRQSVYVPRTHNKFDMSYFNYTTQKFGEYTPFFVMEGLPRDVIPFGSSHDVRSFPMVSPFLSSLKLNKDFFLVPNQAIQPNTWEYIYNHPSQGDDVPDDAQNIWDFWGRYNFVVSAFSNFYRQSPDSQLWIMLIMEQFLSAGSILNRLGYKINLGFQLNNDDSVTYSFDSLFEYLFSPISFNLAIDSDNLNQSFTVNSEGPNHVDLYTGLSLLRRYGSKASITEWFELPREVEHIRVLYIPTNSGSGIDNTTIIRMDRVCAYQLACAQYYVNPQVDFIYNAQLFRDNFFTLLNELSYASSNQRLSISYFLRNGINVPYDFFSAYYYDILSSYMVDAFRSFDSLNQLVLIYDCIHYLLGSRESLRFGDYFTDSRTRPLAIGDNYQPVTGEGVDVIDMSRKIIFQRFRNAVVKLGNNFGDYLRGIFGSEPSPDYHIPKYIVHQEFDINGFEVANTTSNDQGNLITNLRSGDDQFVFEITVDMPCILIGISSFSVPRVYTQTKDRQFLHMTRYDMFNPMLQYFGDQAVYNEERTQLVDGDEVFGYQSRFNEYKQRYSVASGAFAEYLPAWSFIADPLFGTLADPTLINVQSPDFLRAHDYEFNRFFNGYKGISLAKGYHFIVVYNNKCNCHRPLEINPSTL